MALLVATAAARTAGRVGPVIVAHVDHRTRSETQVEARLVAQQAARFGLPFVSVAVSGDDDQHLDGGIESRLRQKRYERLARLARTIGVASVVSAHTRDDQVETVLMRLLSGSSPLAAAGMSSVTRLATTSGDLQVLRPLLQVSRDQLRDLLELTDTPHAEDPSNADTRFRRNAVRHDVIPLLERISPGFGGAILRTIDLARQDAQVIDAMADQVFEEIATHPGTECLIERIALRNYDVAISSRVVKRAIQRMVSGDAREVSYERIRAVLDAASGRTGAVIELPYGLRAVIEREVVRLSRSETMRLRQ